MFGLDVDGLLIPSTKRRWKGEKGGRKGEVEEIASWYEAK